MKKRLTLTLAAVLLLAALTSCRVQVHDPFQDAIEENPDLGDLPQSDVMKPDPDDIPQYEIEDKIDGYESVETFEIPATDEHEAGELVVKYKICTYGDNNLALVSVENHSEQALTVSIDGLCEDTLENKSKTIEREFEGFAANWQNYFVFYPTMPFDEFSYEIDFETYDGETYGQKILNMGWDDIWLYSIPRYDGTGNDTGMTWGLLYDYIGSDWTGADMQFLLFEDDSMENVILYYEQVYTGLGPIDERSGWYRSSLYPAIGKLEGVKWSTLNASYNNSLGPVCGYYPASDAYESSGFELPEPWRDCYGLVGFRHFYGPSGKPVELPKN